MNKIEELIEKSEMNMKGFGEYFEIPYRTLQDWKAGRRKAPEYVIKLLEYKLEKEKNINKK